MKPKTEQSLTDVYPHTLADTTAHEGTERFELSARNRATAFGCFTSVCYHFPHFRQGEHTWDAAAVQRLHTALPELLADAITVHL